MFKRTETYTDYNGVERTEDFYFNFTETELTELEIGTAGGLAETVRVLINAKDVKAIIAIMKDLVFKAYGEKSSDGRRFIKSEEISKAFSETEAYNQIFMDLATNAEAAAAFINGIIPSKLRERVGTLAASAAETNA